MDELDLGGDDGLTVEAVMPSLMQYAIETRLRSLLFTMEKFGNLELVQ
jgi:hypothetical protein